MIRNRKRQYEDQEEEPGMFIPNLQINLGQDEIVDGEGTARLVQSEGDSISIRSDSMQTSLYLLRITENPLVQQFIQENRACKIQRAYRKRFARRVRALIKLQRHCKKAILRAGNLEMRNARFNLQRMRWAMNRITEFYHHIKVKKVAASMALNSK